MLGGLQRRANAIWESIPSTEAEPTPNTQEVNVLKSTAAAAKCIQTGVFGISTIAICYTLFVVLGHGPAWLPMISDCAVTPPEKYIFPIGMIVTGTNIIAVGTLVLSFISSLSTPTKMDTYAKYCVYTAAFGLMGVGSVNEKEQNTIHSTSAVIFFLLAEIFMIYVALRVRKIEADSSRPVFSKASWIAKLVFGVIGFLALITLAVAASLGWHDHHILIAFSEWTATANIIVYFMTFHYDFKDESMKYGIFVPQTTTTTAAAAAAAPHHDGGVAAPMATSTLQQPAVMVTMPRAQPPAAPAPAPQNTMYPSL